MILSDHGNNIDVSKLKKSELKTLLKEIKSALKDYRKMLSLPLTEDESEVFYSMSEDCENDIAIINHFLGDEEGKL